MTDALQIAAQAVRLYAESHPRPPHVTMADAAEMLGISRPTMSRIIKAGIIRLNACGRVPISEIDAALEARRQA